MSNITISSLLLCVGKSKEITKQKKDILKSRIKKMAAELLHSHFHEVVAVLGAEIEAIEAELKGLPLKLVHNEFYFERGLHSAIKAGIMNINLSCDYFAVCLADQEHLSKKDYNKLIQVARSATDALIICPTFNNSVGNPILISSRLIPEILDHEDADHGCFYLFDRYPKNILFVEMDNEAFIKDIHGTNLSSSSVTSPP